MNNDAILAGVLGIVTGFVVCAVAIIAWAVYTFAGF